MARNVIFERLCASHHGKCCPGDTSQLCKFESQNLMGVLWDLTSTLCFIANGCGSGGILVIHSWKGWWFDPWPLQSTCQTVLGLCLILGMFLCVDGKVAPCLAAPASSLWMCVCECECVCVNVCVCVLTAFTTKALYKCSLRPYAPV